jgi:hypothetical protein
MIRALLSLFCLIIAVPTLGAQEGYEYEVYSTHITPRRATKLELHANFVQSGRREIDEGILPTDHALRSSFEVSHGLTPWLEGSFYFVGAVLRDGGAKYVGNRIRVTAIAPSRWELPFDLGVSNEIGYARAGFAEDRWGYELSPILGKSFGPVSVVMNPAIERSFGQGNEHELELEPRGKVSYQFGDEGALSLEYYGALGPATALEPAYEQHHQLFATAQAEIAHRWEIGFGVGRGLTRESDHTTFTTKLEYQFGGDR